MIPAPSEAIIHKKIIFPNPKAFLLLLLSFLVFLFACKNTFYSLDDFAAFPKIDAHVHVNTEKPYFLQQAQKDRFQLLTLNTEVPYYQPIEEQEKLALSQGQAFPGQIQYAAAFTMDGWDNPDWQQKTIDMLEKSLANGAVGVKVWKNIGMSCKNRKGDFIMIDDPQFDAVFEFLVQKNLPVIGHLGEPKNCWLPVEEMTVENDKSYFKNHPEFHMYLHPDFPSYEQQISARDHMLEKHPDLKFIGAHLGSMEWSVDMIAEHLEKYPNLAVDMTARIGHLQYQSIDDYDKVRNFFINYQDRILYATDLQTQGDDDPGLLAKQMHETWISDWKYLATAEVMTSALFQGSFKGLQLPKSVIKKIYRNNVRKWLGIF